MKRLIEVPWDKRAIFISRPNRFLAICSDTEEGGELMVHVRDPGRLKELLYPGNTVLLKRAKGQTRKTHWDLVAAKASSGRWVLVNSGFHSAIATSILLDSQLSPFGKARKIQPEVRVGHSRLDFLIDIENNEKIYMEVKGCTLVKEGTALFPDAPTKRGRKHLLELLALRKKGYRACVMFLILCPGAGCFDANNQTDPLFYETFYHVIEQGVEVYPVGLEYKDGFIWYIKEIAICSK